MYALARVLEEIKTNHPPVWDMYVGHQMALEKKSKPTTRLCGQIYWSSNGLRKQASLLRKRGRVGLDIMYTLLKWLKVVQTEDKKGLPKFLYYLKVCIRGRPVLAVKYQAYSG